MIKKSLIWLARNYLGPMSMRHTYKKKLLTELRRHPKVKRVDKPLDTVLHINTLANAGGAAKVAYQLQTNLLKAGYHSKMLVRDAIPDDQNVVALSYQPDLPGKIRILGEQSLAWPDFANLQSLDIKNTSLFKTCDLLHLHNLHGNYFNLFALPELTSLKPTVWTMHDMQAVTGHCAYSLDCDRWTNGCGSCRYLSVYPPLAVDSTEFLWRTKQKIYANSTLTIVCPSQWLHRIVQNSILGEQDIRVIYNGVDQTIFRPLAQREARARLGLPQDKIILLFSAHGGTGNTWKGGDFIFKTFEQLGDNENLLFVNLGGAQQSSKGNWLDVPYVSDEPTMAMYYAAADLFLYPSLADNCPLVVLESLSCGTPVVTFATGGIPELVEHMQTGYVARHKDLDDFIQGINILLQDKDLRRQSSQRARVMAEERFSLERMVKEYLNLYQEVWQKFYELH